MKKKTAVVLISLSMLASMGTGAYAATKLEEIKAYLNIRIKSTKTFISGSLRLGKI